MSQFDSRLAYKDFHHTPQSVDIRRADDHQKVLAAGQEDWQASQGVRNVVLVDARFLPGVEFHGTVIIGGMALLWDWTISGWTIWDGTLGKWCILLTSNQTTGVR